MAHSVWKKWLKNPLQIGTILPSSQGLADLMLSCMPKNPKVVVEFGAGTGPITKSLIKEYSNVEIFAFELDADFAEIIHEKYPAVHVLNHNVIDAADKIPAEHVGKVDAIFSSLPMLSISEDINKQILEGAFRILKPGGVFIQYTYLPFLPPVRIYKEIDLWAQFIGVEWKNLPPAYVWEFKKMN